MLKSLLLLRFYYFDDLAVKLIDERSKLRIIGARGFNIFLARGFFLGFRLPGD